MNFEKFVKGGAMQKAINSAILEAAVIAKAHGLPEAGIKYVAARHQAVSIQPSKVMDELPKELVVALINPPVIPRVHNV
jgi:hypothetical protein